MGKRPTKGSCDRINIVFFFRSDAYWSRLLGRIIKNLPKSIYTYKYIYIFRYGLIKSIIYGFIETPYNICTKIKPDTTSVYIKRIYMLEKLEWVKRKIKIIRIFGYDTYALTTTLIHDIMNVIMILWSMYTWHLYYIIGLFFVKCYNSVSQTVLRLSDLGAPRAHLD